MQPLWLARPPTPGTAYVQKGGRGAGLVRHVTQGLIIDFMSTWQQAIQKTLTNRRCQGIIPWILYRVKTPLSFILAWKLTEPFDALGTSCGNLMA
jgi:hypothetical protein